MGSGDQPISILLQQFEFKSVQISVLSHLLKPTLGIFVEFLKLRKGSILFDNHEIDLGKSGKASGLELDTRFRINDLEFFKCLCI